MDFLLAGQAVVDSITFVFESFMREDKKAKCTNCTIMDILIVRISSVNTFFLPLGLRIYSFLG